MLSIGCQQGYWYTNKSVMTERCNTYKKVILWLYIREDTVTGFFFCRACFCVQFEKYAELRFRLKKQ